LNRLRVSVCETVRRKRMIDLIFIATAIIFFVISAVYVNGCEKLRGVPRD
jgi:hypothetical protein